MRTEEDAALIHQLSLTSSPFQNESTQFGCSGAVDRHLEVLEQFEAPARVEWPVVEEDRCALAPGSEENAGSGLGPAGVGGAPDPVGLAQIEPVNC